MSYGNWKSRDVARITGLNTLQNVLNMSRDEEKEVRDIVRYWQKNGGIFAFSDQIALIQRTSTNRTFVKFFVYRLTLLNNELFSKYPYRDYLIVCISKAISALQNAIAEASHIRENMKNRAIIEALRSGAVVDSGEQYFLPNKNDEEYEDYGDEEDESIKLR